MIREIQAEDNRSKIVQTRDRVRSINSYLPPKTLGKPRGELAMDSQIKNVLSIYKNELLASGSCFVGYAVLSNIAQEALIRAGVETTADEMTRKFVEWYYNDDGDDNHEKDINELDAEMVKYKIKERFNEACQKDGYFGGCLVYIDVGELDDEERREPLTLDSKTFEKGSFRGLKVIEPINIYPGDYNTSDPTDENYFNPEYWYILGKKYHKSRFLYFASNPAPLLLKPTYNFFGIPRAQLALDYVAQFVANKESAQELLNKFSLTCWKTDMSQVLQGQSSNDLIRRVKMFNKLKHNSGTMVLDKETEDMMQINTPLSGVRDIVEMSLNLLTAVWRIPKIKYIGEGEGGLNASSKEQMHSFYDFIQSQKEKMFTEPLETVRKILLLNIGKEPDEALTFRYPPLWEMDEAERADLNSKKATTAITYINAGVLSQEEVRANLSMDKNSGYSQIDVDDVPEREEPTENIEETVDEDLFLDGLIEDRKKEEDGEWITVKGTHIFIKNGESAKNAIGKFYEMKKKEKDRKVKFAGKQRDYSKGKEESFSEYASRFTDGNITNEDILKDIDVYRSEKGNYYSEEQIQRAIKETEAKIKKGVSTVDLYRKYGERATAVYSDEREKTHKKIVNKLLEGRKASDNPSFILLGGRGGSGKSKFKNTVYNEKDYVVLDADKIKEMLPEYKGWNAYHLHEESADILEKALAKAKEKKLNVVLDATMNGGNTTKRRLELFKNAGYRTEMHYMFLPAQEAAKRAVTRFMDRPDGRYVPINTVLSMKENEKNFQNLKDMVDAYSFSNNDVERGRQPVLVEKKGQFSYKGEKKWI